ncbi:MULTISPECIES: hypothetical protein [unclassified Streptomyces]|uniref:hypothetical protein n=1 Tax=unclassified Streptomyces TaxID=2593676 RepID=UPI000DACBF00|nr:MULTISPECIES: hypothetical protein [unclassified Streptomyces]PZT73767.1 hypothetical protein DNK55_16200 [Streptomyces sp. AC1-42T]PZT83238.1 hypothetical protein DNK56_15225 [Streptomyces sp. AC1-42W]
MNRFVLCAVAAGVATLSGIGPASAASEDVRVTYESSISTNSGNAYEVEITATVTRIGDHYELKGKVKSTCIHSTGPDQKWGLAFGSSAESWRYEEGACGDRRTTYEDINVSGPLLPDGRVYLQAGAFGGNGFGSWGWGTKRSVWV